MASCPGHLPISLLADCGLNSVGGLGGGGGGGGGIGQSHVCNPAP